MLFATVLSSVAMVAGAAYALPTAAKNAERHTAAQEAQDAIVIKILTAYGDNGPFINGELQSLHPPVKEHLLPLYSGSSSPKMYTAEQVDAVVNVLLNGAKE